MRCSSPFIASAVRAITGMDRVDGSLLRRAVACRPSMPGSWMSIRTRSGCSTRARASPDSASLALNTTWPADWSRNVASVMLAGLSSTTRTFAISGGHPATGHRSPYFGDESVTIEVCLFHDRQHVPIELRSILGRDVLRGDHENRDTGCLLTLVERGNHVEAAHLRHHQIEHDEIGELSPRRVDCLLTAVRA